MFPYRPETPTPPSAFDDEGGGGCLGEDGRCHELYGESGPCIYCGVNTCAVCGRVIADGDLYMEVRRHDEADADSRLLAHIGCAGGGGVD